MKVKKWIAKALDCIILLSLVVTMLGLVYLWIKGLQGLSGLVALSANLDSALLFAALTIGMSGGFLFFLQMWIDGIQKTWCSLLS